MGCLYLSLLAKYECIMSYILGVIRPYFIHMILYLYTAGLFIEPSRTALASVEVC